MEFMRENAADANAIVGCDDTAVRLRGRAVGLPAIVSRDVVRDDWRPPGIGALSIADFGTLLALKPEVVLLGTGARQQLPPPLLVADFAARGIGLEVMDNRAACRTYNVLLGELREVAVALLR